MLKYLGGGFIAGVPAKNLTNEQAKQYGVKRLLASGIYELVKDKKKTAFIAVQRDGE